MLNIRSFNDLNLAVANGLHLIDRSRFDVVVGIPRSGMLPATLIATHFQLPLTDVASFARGVLWGRSGVSAPVPARARVLLVDDSCNKGTAMARAVAAIRKNAGAISRLAVFGPYQLADPASVVDIVLAECRGPRIFQWNMWKHKRMPRWGFDFDGVICRDPTSRENDDGPAYLKFLREAEPVHLPARPIGPIITGRLEKYRGETEAYLARHGVQHAGLHMMPFATKAERMAAGGRGQWKAEVAAGLGLEMFIESNPKQAGIIARRASIPVWCTTTQEVFPVPTDAA